jgi:hypothetical protein
MAAVIHLHPGHQPTPVASPKPELRVLEGGRSAGAVALRRMYLRRRILVAAVALVVLFGAVSAVVSTVSSVLASPATSSPTVVHQVERGETLWSLAVAADPQGDPRDTIARIVDLNTGPGSSAAFSADEPLRVGQRLVLPVRP